MELKPECSYQMLTEEVNQQFAVGESISGVHGKYLAIGIQLRMGKLVRKRSNAVSRVSQGVSEGKDPRVSAVRQSRTLSHCDLEEQTNQQNRTRSQHHPCARHDAPGRA